MSQPIAVRTDFTAVEVRRLARRAKDSDQGEAIEAFKKLPRPTAGNPQQSCAGHAGRGVVPG